MKSSFTSILKLPGENVFFTSDTHFCHENIIRFCGRPFKDVHEMDDTLVHNWNKVVPEDGLVFHLGDFCHGGSVEWNSLLDQLHGRIVLILGNHDLKNIRQSYIDRFEFVTQQMTISINGQMVILNHCPFLCYGGSYKDVWQLFGHVHSGPLSKTGLDNNRLQYLFPKQYDVGVDNNNFHPISFAQVKENILRQIETSRRQYCFLESGDSNSVVFLDTEGAKENFWKLDSLRELVAHGCRYFIIAGPLAKKGLSQIKEYWENLGLPGELVGVTSGEGMLSEQIGMWLSLADGYHRYVAFTLNEQEDFRTVHISNGTAVDKDDIRKAIQILA